MASWIRGSLALSLWTSTGSLVGTQRRHSRHRWRPRRHDWRWWRDWRRLVRARPRRIFGRPGRFYRRALRAALGSQPSRLAADELCRRHRLDWRRRSGRRLWWKLSGHSHGRQRRIDARHPQSCRAVPDFVEPHGQTSAGRRRRRYVRAAAGCRGARRLPARSDHLSLRPARAFDEAVFSPLVFLARRVARHVE